MSPVFSRSAGCRPLTLARFSRPSQAWPHCVRALSGHRSAITKRVKAEAINSQYEGPPCPPDEIKYILPMFPYPSGRLHMGHVRVYTIADTLARFHRLQGHHTIMPIGWDAFGLPAENAALEHGIDPALWTKANIANMRKQLHLMNCNFDWDREISTCTPEFYKHTQKIFLLLYEQGLAYQKEALVNYDPVDKTVLANEQVDAGGHSWRSGAKVEKRRLKQWFFRISQFSESLLQDLEVLAKDNKWPDRVLAMQRNWLGKSTGAILKFPVTTQSHLSHAAIEVYTTRPETLLGVQYLALAATHHIVTDLAKSDPELQAFLDTLPGLPPDSKVGYMLPNIRAVSPLDYQSAAPDATKSSLPIYVAPYVLGHYGVGAVMGVPGHDVRDHAFWKHHHHDQPVRVVLAASEYESMTATLNAPFVGQGVMTENAGPFKGKSSKEAREMLMRILEPLELAKPVEKWRLRDWLVSRQRYWGTPIPIIHCNSCGAVPVPDGQLPVQLPKVGGFWAKGKPGNPLEAASDWVETSCPKCGGPARRDTDTLDTFVDSSWYYMRFVDPKNKELPFSREKAAVLPVDIYVGGIEHAILHLLYARFIYKVLMTSPLAPDGAAGAVHEPFSRLITQGMVQGKTFSDPSNGRYLRPDEVDLKSDPANPKIAATGDAPTVTWEKMSKSKHNGVDPTELITKDGADAVRIHMLFQAPVGNAVNWDADKIMGVSRWLDRLWKYVSSRRFEEVVGQTQAEVSDQIRERAARVEGMDAQHLKQWEVDCAVWQQVQKTIKSVTDSYNRVDSLNTAVSDLMILSNDIMVNKGASCSVRRAALDALIKMLAPMAPSFSTLCWKRLNPNVASETMFSGVAWFPVTDGTLPLVLPKTGHVAIQINGHLRAVLKLPHPPEGSLSQGKIQEWFIKKIMANKEGRYKFREKALQRATRVYASGNKKVVNFVIPPLEGDVEESLQQKRYGPPRREMRNRFLKLRQ